MNLKTTQNNYSENINLISYVFYWMSVDSDMNKIFVKWCICIPSVMRIWWTDMAEICREKTFWKRNVAIYWLSTLNRVARFLINTRLIWIYISWTVHIRTQNTQIAFFFKWNSSNVHLMKQIILPYLVGPSRN